MRIILILIAGVLAGGALGCSGCAAPKDEVVEKESGVPMTSVTGVLRGGMMAIGGESTGWVVQHEDGTQTEVDVAKVRERAQGFDGQRVRVDGLIVEKKYIERGAVKVLVAHRIEAP